MVVLDQVGSWVLDRHLPVLPAAGLVRRVRAEGVFHHRVVFENAATLTAVGHAAIYTGRAPRDSGIVTNLVWNAARKKAIGMLDDGSHAVLGMPGRFASPAAVRVESVADVLKSATNGAGRVVSLSMKERGAVLGGGQHPDVALWYEARLRGFSTSTWYAETLPEWLRRFRKKNPMRRLFGRTWIPLDVARLAGLAGRDDGPGEGVFRGLGRTFPHELRDLPKAEEALHATPQSTELLLALVRRVVKREDLGEDETPDLLAISISGTDYVGHVWGPESWEMADNLMRVDLALAELLEWLEARGPVAMLVTADHGAPPVPEGERGRRMGGRRVLERELLRAADEGIDGALGAGEWIQTYEAPYVYLRPAALAKRARAVPAAIAAIRALPGIAAAYDVADVRRWREPADPLRHAVWRSVAPDRGGEIYIVVRRGTILGDGTPARSGSDHGSPWDYDTQVPVLAIGSGVGRLETRRALPQSRIAATIAALLGVRPPTGAPASPLPLAADPTR